MITTVDLNQQTRRELTVIAREYGVAGWHGMKKEELVTEIKKIQRKLRRKTAADHPTETGGGAHPGSQPTKTNAGDAKKTRVNRSPKSRSTKRSVKNSSSPDLTQPKVSAKTERIRAEMRRRRQLQASRRDLSTGTLVGGSAMIDGAEHKRRPKTHRDRVALIVRDSYWLQATWEITAASVARAASSMGDRWQSATPTLRLLAIGDVASNNAETVQRDIAIHGGVSNWYVDVTDPPGRFRVAIGYVTDDGTFHTLCRSNIVKTPAPGDCTRLDEHWDDIAEDYQRVYSLSGGYGNDSSDLKEMFEERLGRTMPSASGSSAESTLLRPSKVTLDVEAELIIFGRSDTTATVTVSGRPVKLQPDGSFTVRLELPDRRQVLPVTAETRDGLRQRTTVIGVERNTKRLDTVEKTEM